MSAAGVGFSFVVCLGIGTGFGFLFGGAETGGAIGLATGLVISALFREKKRL